MKSKAVPVDVVAARAWLKSVADELKDITGEPARMRAVRQLITIKRACQERPREGGAIGHVVAVLAYDMEQAFDPAVGFEGILVRLLLPDMKKGTVAAWRKILMALRLGNLSEFQLCVLGVAKAAKLAPNRRPEEPLYEGADKDVKKLVSSVLHGTAAIPSKRLATAIRAIKREKPKPTKIRKPGKR